MPSTVVFNLHEKLKEREYRVNCKGKIHEKHVTRKKTILMITESPSLEFSPTGFSFDNDSLVISKNILLDNLPSVLIEKKRKSASLYAF